jgi:hypothetical protein
LQEFNGMKTALAVIVCFSFLGLAAQSLSAQKPSAGSRAPAVAPTAPVVGASPALSAALTNLERVSAATESDLANFRPEKRSSGWKSAWHFWRRSNSQSQQTEQMAVSLQKNLHDAMPGLIRDAQTSGSFAATFKLYNNLSVVCELLDALVETTKSDGKGDESLVNDAAAMGRIRQGLATYVEQAAAVLDSKGKPYAVTSNPAGKPKKIVIDDTAPEKKPKKKTASNQ